MTHPTAMPLAVAPVKLSPLLAIVAALPVLAVLLAGWLIRRSRARAGSGRSGTPAVWVAALAAVGCTAYSADTSWRFAADYLDMAGTAERAAMFGAAELALFATALMARQNLTSQGAPGLPGVLVWVITGVQVIPAYAESGPVGGTVRAFVGPVMAAMLWHQAMGIELRLRTPEAASHGVLATLGREVRERVLSRLGVAERDRDAAQITRDRATAQAVALAARLAERSPKRRENWHGRRIARRLSKALARAGVGTDLKQRRDLLDQLAARRHATALATVDLPSPWAQSTQAHKQHGQDTPIHHLPVPDHTTVPGHPGRWLHTVPAPGPATLDPLIGDRPAGNHAGPSTTGTEPTHNGDRADGDGSCPATGTGSRDQTSALPGDDETGDNADGTAGHAHETAAQGATNPSLTPFPDDGDRNSTLPAPEESANHADGTGETATKATSGDCRPGSASVWPDPGSGNRIDTLHGTDTRGDGPQPVPGTDNGPRPRPLSSDGDDGNLVDAVPGTVENGDRPHPVPDNGDRVLAGPVPTTQMNSSGDRSRAGQGQQTGSRLSEDELVARVLPHIPAVLERDRNGAVTRVQLREILRAQHIPIRNDRLTPVLQRLRSETGTTTNRSLTR